jgi:hypothetical protein
MTDLLDEVTEELDETLYEHLEEKRLFQYGSRFPRTIVWEFLDLVDGAAKTRREHETFQLKELGAMGPIRNKLIKLGMYIKQDGDFYRILLPSQNAGKVAGYYASAGRQIRKAQLLSFTTPTQPGEVSTTDAKIAMRLDAIEREVQHQKNLA